MLLGIITLAKSRNITLSLGLFLITMLVLSCLSTSVFNLHIQALAQQYIPTIKYRNLMIDLGNRIKTNAQITYPVVGKGPFPGVLLVPGAGLTDMNYSGDYIRIDNKTGSKIYPPAIFFQIAQYLSERGFAVLRFDKRGVGANLTVADSKVWKNMTYNDLVQDAHKALNVLIHQPEVNPNKISILGHSEGGETVTRIAIDNPATAKIKNIVLLDARIQKARNVMHYLFVDLPLEYAKEILDKNHNGSISLQEASRDKIFQGIVGGNISSLLSTNINSNITKPLKPEYSPNNDINININSELKSILEKRSEDMLKAFRCEVPSPCPTYLRSLLNLNSTLDIIGNVPSSTGILMLHGQNDSGSPVQQAFLLQQRLTELNHPDHTLITYPNLGHTLYPSSQWQTSSGPIPSYVLADLYAWLESHSGFTSHTTAAAHVTSISSSNSTAK
jgi:pimeloyl-ACP methyl ester carboxylesterase